MMNFKTFFKLFLESPDSSTTGKGKAVSYYDSGNYTGRSFLFNNDGGLLATTGRFTHHETLENYKEFLENEDAGIKGDTDVMVLGTISSSLQSQIKSGEIAFRHHFADTYERTGVIGRVWPADDHLSFWNTEQTFNSQNIKWVYKMLKVLNVDPNDCSYEVLLSGNYGDYTMWTWKDMLNNIEAREHKPIAFIPTSDKIKEMQKQIHLIPPEIKGNVMKQMGIKPKQAPDIRERFWKHQGD